MLAYFIQSILQKLATSRGLELSFTKRRRSIKAMDEIVGFPFQI